MGPHSALERFHCGGEEEVSLGAPNWLSTTPCLGREQFWGHPVGWGELYHTPLGDETGAPNEGWELYCTPPGEGISLGASIWGSTTPCLRMEGFWGHSAGDLLLLV